MRLLLFIIAGLYALNCAALEEIYQSPDDFLRTSFSSEVPPDAILWIDAALKPHVKQILGHDYHKLRIRYWRKDRRTAWILEEIGKERYITTGIVVAGNALERVKILIFRESRGWEIKHDFFTDQFNNAKLRADLKLSQSIDNITGATLSVQAVERLARLALFLNQVITQQNEQVTP